MASRGKRKNVSQEFIDDSDDPDDTGVGKPFNDEECSTHDNLEFITVFLIYVLANRRMVTLICVEVVNACSSSVLLYKRMHAYGG